MPAPTSCREIPLRPYYLFANQNFFDEQKVSVLDYACRSCSLLQLLF